VRPSLVYQAERELELRELLAAIAVALEHAGRELDRWLEELER